MATSLPERVIRAHPREAGSLGNWHRYGWLGTEHKGSGHPVEWASHDTEQQISWLGRLRDAGRTLDAEDAAGGFRLRARGNQWALRIGSGRWVGYDDLAVMLEAAIVARQEPCTLALVIF